ncbi:MAG TPA: hypothetical protein PKM88_01770 [bacterium]|nr:hypothetical protein [bacterium]
MHLNAFVLAAQLVNFLLLLVLLKHFLYDRIAAAMTARAAAIAAEQQQARSAQAAAAAAEAAAAAREQQLAAERDRLLADTRTAAEQERALLLAQARDEAAAQRRQWQDDLRREQHEFVCAFQVRAAGQVCAATGRMLTELADAELDRQLVLAFLRRVAALDAPGRAQFTAGPIVMRSSSPFPADLRDQCARTWQALLGRMPELRYETAPELGTGLEARSAGHSLAWTADRYLDELAADLTAAFRDKAGAA